MRAEGPQDAIPRGASTSADAPKSDICEMREKIGPSPDARGRRGVAFNGRQERARCGDRLNQRHANQRREGGGGRGGALAKRVEQSRHKPCQNTGSMIATTCPLAASGGLVSQYLSRLCTVHKTETAHLCHTAGSEAMLSAKKRVLSICLVLYLAFEHISQCRGVASTDVSQKPARAGPFTQQRSRAYIIKQLRSRQAIHEYRLGSREAQRGC